MLNLLFIVVGHVLTASEIYHVFRPIELRTPQWELSFNPEQNKQGRK